MGFNSERASIESRLQDNWSTTTIKIENVPFKTPTDQSPWIRLTIIDGESNQIDLAGLHRRVGIIIISVFTQKNSGTVTARTYADTIAAIYRSARFGNVVCYSPTIIRVGTTEEWYQLNIKIPFYVDEVY